MRVKRASDLWIADLLTAPFTYDAVGATAGELPPGYHHVRRSRLLGHGRGHFKWASTEVMTWGLHRRAGLEVEASADLAAPGVVSLVAIRFGPVRMVAPCRVVSTVHRPAARGFAYGTLPGHPERGEESFTVRLEDDGRVMLHIVAFSRPATWWARAGQPVASRMQRLYTTRYLQALVD